MQQDKNPNPQGKGLTPVLQQRQNLLADFVEEKSASQILADYAISLLVLSARFHFKPSPLQSYSLYLKDQRLGLSLIEPEAWPTSMGKLVAQCYLKADMTWEVEQTLFDPDDDEVVQLLDYFIQGFSDQLGRTQTMEQGLPFFEEHLPFYPRLFASVMAKSLEQSMSKANLLGQANQYWLSQLDTSRLLAPASD